MGRIVLLLAIALCSCTRTVYVPTETVRTDSISRAVIRTDTVIDRDTVTTFIHGDTLLREVTRWRWRTHVSHDTLYIERTDSIPVPYPVKRELSRWEQTKISIGGIAITTLVIVLCMAVVWIVIRYRHR